MGEKRKMYAVQKTKVHNIEIVGCSMTILPYCKNLKEVLKRIRQIAEKGGMWWNPRTQG